MKNFIKNQLSKYDKDNKLLYLIRSFIRAFRFFFNWLYLIPYAAKVYKKQKKKCYELANFSKIIQVIFIVKNPSQWKYEHLYRIFEKHEGYNPKIILIPNFQNNTWLYDYKLCISKFTNKNYSVLEYWNIHQKKSNPFKKENYDIIFFQKPTDDSDILPISFFENALTCYAPYSTYGDNNLQNQYNQPFHNLLWRHYVPTLMHLKMGKSTSFIKGRNIRAIGYPSGDFLLKKIPIVNSNAKWKKSKTIKKKIIWAPHHTIKDIKNYISHSNFLWLSGPMIELAKKYKNEVQFIFKPHPNLKLELIKNTSWGKKKTNEYYNQWNELENCQLEESDYIKIFLDSDALIHDSVSFLAEYLYTLKPCCFVLKNVDDFNTSFNEFGKRAVELHQVVSSVDDIDIFIQKIVNNDLKDYHFEKKRLFIEQVLNINGTELVSESIFKDIENQIKNYAEI